MVAINGEWDLSSEELAILFALKGWTYASPDFGYGTPDAISIVKVLKALVTHAANSPGGTYGTLGRFLVMKDSELPNSFDLYVRVAYVWDDRELDEDEQSIIEDFFGDGA